MVRTRSHSANKFLSSLNLQRNHFTAPPIIDVNEEDSDLPRPPPLHAAKPTRHRHRRSLTPIEIEDPQTQLNTIDEMRYNIPNSNYVFRY